MAKSMRSKREKRLRAIRREMVEPLYDKKDEAKLAAQEAAMAAPKLTVRPSPFSTNNAASMDVTTDTNTQTTSAATSTMDVEMDVGNQNKGPLKPVGKIGKKLKMKIKISKRKRRGKGKIGGKRHI